MQFALANAYEENNDFEKALKKVPPSGRDDFSQQSINRFRKKRTEDTKKKDYIA